jgi:hypothetical protein
VAAAGEPLKRIGASEATGFGWGWTDSGWKVRQTGTPKTTHAAANPNHAIVDDAPINTKNKQTKPPIAVPVPTPA